MTQVELRLATEADAPFLLELLNDPDWLRFIGDRGVRSLEDARAFVQRLATHHQTHGFGFWVLCHAGEALGLAGLVRRDGLPHVDLGYALLPRGRGRGLVQAAVSLILERARALGLDPLLAICTPDNVRSRRVLERFGFQYLRLVTLPGDTEELCLYELRRG